MIAILDINSFTANGVVGAAAALLAVLTVNYLRQTSKAYDRSQANDARLSAQADAERDREREERLRQEARYEALIRDLIIDHRKQEATLYDRIDTLEKYLLRNLGGFPRDEST